VDFKHIAGITILLWATSTEISDLATRSALLIPVGALLGAVAFAWAGYVIHDVRALAAPASTAPATSFNQVSQLTPAQSTPSVDQSVNSYNQSGGVTARTVIVGAPKRDLDTPWGDHLKSQMLSELPRDKEISVMALMGDVEAADLAIQIHKFLKANGFKMTEDGISQGLFTVPLHGLSYSKDTNTFIVGAR
jgi:hypothetical protein